MKTAKFFLTLAATGLLYADPAAFVNYKLILGASASEQEVKNQLFDKILNDFAVNQKRNLTKIQSWDDETVMTHFGKMASEAGMNLENTSQDVQSVRQTIARAITNRTKELARQVWKQIESTSLDKLREMLGKTMDYDSLAQKEAESAAGTMKADKIEGNHPSSPWIRPMYADQLNNYYGYNYLYNYYNYNYTNGTYGVYNTYPGTNYYQPVFRNGYYQYVQNSYYPNYYQTWYRPVYNRTNRLLSTGVFGLAAAGSFVDWLLYY